MNKLIIAAIVLCAAGLTFSLMLPGMYLRGYVLPRAAYRAVGRVPPQRAYPHPGKAPIGTPVDLAQQAPKGEPKGTTQPGALSGQVPVTSAAPAPLRKSPGAKSSAGQAPKTPPAPPKKADPPKIERPELPGLPSAAEKRSMAKKRTGDNARLLGQYVTLPDGMTGKEKDAFLDKLAASDMSPAKKKTVTFGSYPQKTDQKEPIEWVVLAVIPDRYMLLCSKRILECRPASDDPAGEPAQWETSSLRRWLNEDFYDEAFNEEEKGRIAASRVPVSASGKETEFTEDKVFVPCVNETRLPVYFFGPDSRKCAPTEFASDEGTSANPDAGFAAWWIRGEKGAGLAQISPAGAPAGALTPAAGARPFVWIKLTKSG
ncbi:MAG: hypothetical protein IK083_06990 [Abditibacteriota bacterium]|nr:hypothetical protein [Abditibacteriota bacterium]